MLSAAQQTRVIRALRHALWQHRSLTWEGGDVVFEEAVSFSGLGHEASERSLHVSPLTRCLLSHHLVVRHRLSERLRAGGKTRRSHVTS